MILYLREELARAWVGEDIFRLLDTLPGEVYRDKEGRRTLRFRLGGHLRHEMVDIRKGGRR